VHFFIQLLSCGLVSYLHSFIKLSVLCVTETLLVEDGFHHMFKKNRIFYLALEANVVDGF